MRGKNEKINWGKLGETFMGGEKKLELIEENQGKINWGKKWEEIKGKLMRW